MDDSVSKSPHSATNGVGCMVAFLDTGMTDAVVLSLYMLDERTGNIRIECLACDGLAGDITGRFS